MALRQTFTFGSAEFLFDSEGSPQTEIWFTLPALHMALIERDQDLVGEHWDGPGLYFLLGPGSGSGDYRIYVGKTMAGVAGRIGQHRRTKDWWDRALVCVADRTYGFTETDISWLEARFIGKLRADIGEERVANVPLPRPGDLRDHKASELEANAAPIEAVLHLLGVLTPSKEPELVEDGDDESGARGKVRRTWVDVSTEVLRQHTGPLHAKSLLEEIVRLGLRDVSNAKTPENTLRRDLRQESRKLGGVIVQTGPSTFDIRR